MIIRRTWAMPDKNTFDIKPIGLMVKKYLSTSRVSVDPFARNNGWSTYTNDLNPATKAQYNMDALAFLEMLKKEAIKANLVVFDPPYSPRQVKECYQGVGLKMKQTDGHRTHAWSKEKDVIDNILTDDGIVLSFGWNSMGMGKKRGFEIIEILLVCHGAGHNDTICIAEKRKGTKEEQTNHLPIKNHEP